MAKAVATSRIHMSQGDTRTSLRYLKPQEYSLWDKLVETSPQGSVFCRSWYLAAVAGDFVILGCFEAGELVAGIPLYFERKFGFELCTMPRLTATWGVVIRNADGLRHQPALHETDILGKFAGKLSGNGIFFHKFHPSLENWRPFEREGFIQTARFTYVLEDLGDLGQIWQGMRHSIRGEIRKAERSGLTVEPCGIKEVYDAEAKTFARQRRSAPRTLEFLDRVYRAAKERNAGECFAVCDGEGRVHAANMLVWDAKRAYFLAGGADPSLRSSGATSLMVWHLIQFTAERSVVFDFDGSVLEPVERFFRSFGAKQVPYHWIMKFPFWLHSYLAAKHAI